MVRQWNNSMTQHGQYQLTAVVVQVTADQTGCAPKSFNIPERRPYIMPVFSPIILIMKHQIYEYCHIKCKKVSRFRK